MRGWKGILFVITVLAMIPGAALAQSGASISGTVKDASGAVLPGVTVEAASPALIEKTRTAVTDGTGQFRITELLPGTYTVTLTLTGFSTVKREGIELTGSFIATLNVDMKIGNVAETITVSGETPIVDVQATTRQTVITHTELDALPTGKNMFNVGVLIPGVTITTGGLANQDVGGALGPNTLALGIHGGRTQDQRFTMNGISLSTMIGGGWGGGTIPNPAGVSEMLFDTSAVDASLSTGGVRINFIAKDGGNRFSGTTSFLFANSSMQGDNFTQRLRDLGLTTPGGSICPAGIKARTRRCLASSTTSTPTTRTHGSTCRTPRSRRCSTASGATIRRGWPCRRRQEISSGFSLTGRTTASVRSVSPA
jgi:hypothetical protein